MKTNSIASSIFVILGVGAAAVACLDVTPTTDVPVVAADAAVDDDAAVAKEVAKSTCFQCSAGESETGPSCGAEYTTCHGSPKCLALFMCGLPKGCCAPGQDLIACLTACGIFAGLTGADDPAVGPFLALYTCATTSCKDACAANPPK